MELALCQRTSRPNDVQRNLDTVLGVIDRIHADVYVFPELFLSGYSYDTGLDFTAVDSALEHLRSVSGERDIAIVVGAPERSVEGTYNCAYALASGGMHRYRKIHLPSFGPFDEKSRFVRGSDAVVFEHKGFRFGLSICYDLFFPELIKRCTLKEGADVNVCISASPVTSRPAFDRVIPARAVENTAYMAYVNNIGPMGGLEFFGGSRLLAPNGDMIGELSGIEDIVFELDRRTIDDARMMRPVLEDSFL